MCSRVKSACQKRPTGVELDLLASRARVKSAALTFQGFHYYVLAGRCLPHAASRSMKSTRGHCLKERVSATAGPGSKRLRSMCAVY